MLIARSVGRVGVKQRWNIIFCWRPSWSVCISNLTRIRFCFSSAILRFRGNTSDCRAFFSTSMSSAIFWKWSWMEMSNQQWQASRIPLLPLSPASLQRFSCAQHSRQSFVPESKLFGCSWPHLEPKQKGIEISKTSFDQLQPYSPEITSTEHRVEQSLDTHDLGLWCILCWLPEINPLRIDNFHTWLARLLITAWMILSPNRVKTHRILSFLKLMSHP